MASGIKHDDRKGEMTDTNLPYDFMKAFFVKREIKNSIKYKGKPGVIQLSETLRKLGIPHLMDKEECSE